MLATINDALNEGIPEGEIVERLIAEDGYTSTEAVRYLWETKQAREVTRALTLWPEWAYAIVRLGKRIENRGWPPPRDLRRFCIHAGKQIGGSSSAEDVRGSIAEVLQVASDAGCRWEGRTMAQMDRQRYRQLEEETIEAVCQMRGSLVCVVELAGVRARRSAGRDGWHMPDSLGWELREQIITLPSIAARGAQRLWLLNEEQRIAVKAAIGNGSQACAT